MDKLLLFFSYIIFTLVTVQLASILIGIQNKDWRILLISIVGGIADFIVKEVLVPHYGLMNGLHFITGITTLSISCYLILEIRLGSAIFVSILSYILGAISEAFSFLLIASIWGKDMLISLSKNSFMISILGLSSLIPIIIPTIYLKIKKRKLSLG